jgi:hypothetical protein
MPKKRDPSTIEVGVSGLRQYGGRIAEEWHPNLRGRNAFRIYEEMRDNDAVIGAVLYSIEAFLRKMEWGVEAADDSEEAKKEADFLRSCMHDMESPWEDFVSDVLSFLVYGYSLHEVVYKLRLGPDETNPRYYSKDSDARFGWRALACRPQSTIDRWDIDEETGEILGAFQVPNTGTKQAEYYLPMNRCVLFRTKSYKNNPEGRSILRNAYRSWYLKKRIEEIEAIGIARDLNGVPVMQVPAQIMSSTASAAQKATRAAMEAAVSKIHRDELEGLVIPSELEPGETNVATGYKFTLLSTNGGKQTAADPIIRRYDARIAMSMAAEFIILGTEKQGSFALGAEKSASFVRSLYWYGNTIAATLNKTAVKRLYDVNGVPVERRARICPGELDAPDLQSLGLFLQSITSNGLLHPTPAVEERLREFADLPEESEDLEALFAEEKAQQQQQAELDAQTAQAQIAATNAKAQPAPAQPKPGKKQ